MYRTHVELIRVFIFRWGKMLRFSFFESKFNEEKEIKMLFVAVVFGGS
jgi:hypothetical protein